MLRESTVNVLKSNLPFFHQLDDAVLHTLCEKESGSFYDSFSDRLEWMLKCDEFAGVLEIPGMVYGSNCPIYIYNESNGEFVCGMKYGDDTFPNVEPIRLLYSSDTPSSPGHYDVLINQHTISNTHTVIDAATDPQGFLIVGEIYAGFAHIKIKNQISTEFLLTGVGRLCLQLLIMMI